MRNSSLIEQPPTIHYVLTAYLTTPEIVPVFNSLMWTSPFYDIELCFKMLGWKIHSIDILSINMCVELIFLFRMCGLNWSFIGHLGNISLIIRMTESLDGFTLRVCRIGRRAVSSHDIGMTQGPLNKSEKPSLIFLDEQFHLPTASQYWETIQNANVFYVNSKWFSPMSIRENCDPLDENIDRHTAHIILSWPN